LEADAETLFDRKASEIWPMLIQRISANWVQIENAERLKVQPSHWPQSGQVDRRQNFFGI
jgi:hypothetical protein